MALEIDSLFGKRLTPSVFQPDTAGILKESLAFLDPRQALELGTEWMIGGNEQLFPVQNGTVRTVPIAARFHTKSLQMYRQRFIQGRMRVVIESRITQLGYFRFVAMSFDDVGSLNPPEIAACTPFVQAQQG